MTEHPAPPVTAADPTEPDPMQLWIARVLLVVIGVAVPGFGLLSAQVANPDHPSSMPFRVGVALVAFGLYAGSYRWHGLRARLRYICIVLACIVQGWFSWVATVSGMGSGQDVGLVLISVASVPLFTTGREVAAFAVYTMAVQALGYGLAPVPPKIPLPTLLATQVVVFGSVGTILVGRRRMDEELRNARVDLQKQVALRTGALVTSLSQLEAEVRERSVAEEKAEAANRTTSVLLANMSHELRTPLNAIMGYAGILREDLADRGDDTADVDRIDSAARHLLQMINDVLDLSRIEAGKLAITYSRVDLAPLAGRVIQMVRTAADQRGNKIVADVPEDIDVHTDPVRLEQILVNLLSNAVKFTENGVITVSAERPVGWVVLRVSDTGIGMSEEAIGQLFQKFVQVDPTSTRRYGGTGLGLALVRELTVRLGGRVDVTSQLGQGSTFTVHLPTREDPDRGRDPADRLEGHGDRETQGVPIDSEPTSEVLLLEPSGSPTGTRRG